MQKAACEEENCGRGSSFTRDDAHGNITCMLGKLDVPSCEVELRRGSKMSVYEMALGALGDLGTTFVENDNNSLHKEGH